LARAVGFDLDHTLAVYNDCVVNAVAWRETRSRLIHHNLPRAGQLPRRYPGEPIVRGLFIDLVSGTLCKTDAFGRVLLEAPRGSLAPASTSPTRRTLTPKWPACFIVGSAFDMVTATLFPALAPGVPPTAAQFVALCRTVREQLDAVHTRGTLKEYILAETASCVRALTISSAHLDMLRATGRSLFVLTNSEPAYTIALLDYLFDGHTLPHWYDVFHTVVTGATKPQFFHATGARGRRFESISVRGACRVVAGGTAAELESILDCRPRNILYAGDHPLHDISPAAGRGWKPVAILPERNHGRRHGPWGDPLRAGGSASWLEGACRADCLGIEPDAATFVESLVDPGSVRRDTSD